MLLRLMCCLLFAHFAPPIRLATYDRVFDALKKGETVKVAIQYGKCKLFSEGKEEEAPDATGGLEIKNWEQFGRNVVHNPKAYFATSETALISHPRYGYVLNYVKIRVFEDNTVEINVRYVKPTTYETVMDETFKGELSGGKDEKGVSCFVVK